MLKGSHSFEEEELSLRKLVAAVSHRGECGGQRKGGTLHQSFANRRADRPPVARHGERPNEIPCVVRINQEKWCVVPSPDGVCGGGEGGGAGKGGGGRERSNKEIDAGEAAKCSVKRGVVEPCVWDPFTSELIREGRCASMWQPCATRVASVGVSRATVGCAGLATRRTRMRAMMAYSPDEPTTCRVNSCE